MTALESSVQGHNANRAVPRGRLLMNSGVYGYPKMTTAYMQEPTMLGVRWYSSTGNLLAGSNDLQIRANRERKHATPLVPA